MTAVGTKLGERARTDATVLEKLRAAPDADSFRLTVRLLADGVVPDVLVKLFVEEAVTDEDWEKWRARLVLQAKMARDGGKPAPGHEAGRGVRKG